MASRYVQITWFRFWSINRSSCIRNWDDFCWKVTKIECYFDIFYWKWFNFRIIGFIEQLLVLKCCNSFNFWTNLFFIKVPNFCQLIPSISNDVFFFLLLQDEKELLWPLCYGFYLFANLQTGQLQFKRGNLFFYFYLIKFNRRTCE